MPILPIPIGVVRRNAKQGTPLCTYTSELLQTQNNCMVYGYYIPFISMITSCLSCVSVSKEYFSNT